MDISTLIKSIHLSDKSGGHIQGIAFDKKLDFVYASFTTVLVKADMQGNILGSVSGIVGHLGCIDFNDADGRVYGSIEYKHDSIGKGISQRLGVTLADEDAFYMAVFDVDKIDRLDMDAEKDGIMRAVYLPDVVEDYTYTHPDGRAHRYGCSGIDGTAIGPRPGCGKSGDTMLYVAYGVYGDVNRNDNDCQVILEYDWRDICNIAAPLSQAKPHHEGIRCSEKYFLYTGNTNFGIQNLEYDADTGDYFAAVYNGAKPNFPNYSLFRIDGKMAPEYKEIPNFCGECGKMLSLSSNGIFDAKSNTFGYRFPYGSTGIYSLGNGLFYISHNGRAENGDRISDIKLYRYNGKDDGPFELV